MNGSYFRTKGKKSRCKHCEAHVTRDFRRTFGDDDNRAHRCPECDTFIRLSRGSGAGLDLDIPDPETALGRHGGESP